MKYIFSILGIIFLCAVVFVFSPPWLAQNKFNSECDIVSEVCIRNAIAIGHIWSSSVALYYDLETAADWYRYSANAGDASAIFHLAWVLDRQGMHEEDESKRNILWEESAKLYAKSARKGFAPASNNLAQHYIARKKDANGCPMKSTAEYWYQLSGVNSHPFIRLNTLSGNDQQALYSKKGISIDISDVPEVYFGKRTMERTYLWRGDPLLWIIDGLREAKQASKSTYVFSPVNAGSVSVARANNGAELNSVNGRLIDGIPQFKPIEETRGVTCH